MMIMKKKTGDVIADWENELSSLQRDCFESVATKSFLSIKNKRIAILLNEMQLQTELETSLG